MVKIKLSNGVEMPQLGYGVYQVGPDPTHPSPRLARNMESMKCQKREGKSKACLFLE
nr:hypothetical protein [Prevotella sp.]